MKNSKDMNTETENMSLTLGGGSSSRDSVREPERPPRIIMGQGMNLAIPKGLVDETKYKIRWFAENQTKAGKIAQAKGAYWEHVQDEHGSNYQRPSGGDTMYLMKLPIKYWQEDLSLKRKKVQATLDSETKIGKGEYSPSGKESAVTRSISHSPD